MLRSFIDHITVTAPTLEAGVEFVQRALGVRPLPGGEHPRMGTHNCLLRLGDELFLEVIAVNRAARAPERPRWFALDRLPSDAVPRLAMWVARVDDIGEALQASPLALGEIEPMTRGELNWLISIPRDGSLPADGIAPTLIEWRTATHPARGMPDLGCSLIRLEARHPDANRISQLLQAIGFEGQLTLAPGAPALAAWIATPAGPRRLGGPDSFTTIPGA